MRLFFIFISTLLIFSTSVLADEYRPACLELIQISNDEYKMLWKGPAKGHNKRLSLYVSFPAGVIWKSEPIGAFIGDAFIERATISRQGGLAGV